MNLLLRHIALAIGPRLDECNGTDWDLGLTNPRLDDNANLAVDYTLIIRFKDANGRECVTQYWGNIAIDYGNKPKILIEKERMEQNGNNGASLRIPFGYMSNYYADREIAEKALKVAEQLLG